MSTFVSGMMLAILIAYGSSVLGMIPLAALIAVMIYVSFVTFDWNELKRMFRNRDGNSLRNSAVTILTFVIILLTENLAYGAATGLLLMGLFRLFQHHALNRT